MSNKPYSICTARKGKDGKTFWNRVGTAWPDQKGGFNLQFEAMPIPTYSDEYGLRVEAKIFPPRDEQSGGDDLDDGEVPF